MTSPLTAGSPWRSGRVQQVNARYTEFLTAGFPVMFDGQAETLQCRIPLDRTNWLYLEGKCRQAFAAGLGDEPIPEPGLRCTSNRFYRPTYAETLVILDDLGAWAAQAQANWWRLKDAVQAATTRDELNSIDLEEGWPSAS